MENLSPTAKHTLTLPRPVYEALKKAAQAQGLEPYEVMQTLIVDYVIKRGTLDKAFEKKVLLGRELVGKAVETAKRLCREGKFASDITLQTFIECMKDQTWAEQYEQYVGDNPYKNGNPLKAINKEIGFRIRAGIGGKVKADEKPVKVNGQIIQSYTAMSGFDPLMVQ